MLVPKLFTTLKTYDREQLVADLLAGTIVGVVALPLAIAFAIASGVSPERGLYTAIVAGFIISALGGSRVQIGGPTGAFIIIVYGIVQTYGIDGLTVATIMAGVIMLALGFSRLGSMIKFVPLPLITGFTSGIAVIIFSSQVKDLLGLPMGDVPAGFVDKWIAFAGHFGQASWPTVGLSALSLGILLYWPRISKRVPAPIVALILCTIVAELFALPVETISSRFGEITRSLPMPSIPHVTLADVRNLVAPAFSIAMLGSIESLLSAVVSDAMIGGRHRSKMELVAQGVANVVSPLVGGIPATGAIARTATNVRNGGRTPIAGIWHAVTLLLITVFFGSLAGRIPLAVLAAILVIVAYQMSEWRTFRSELRGPRGDVFVLVLTFLLTVFVDLTVAITVGMILASFLFMQRVAESAQVTAVTRELGDAEQELDAADRALLESVPRDVAIYEINGPFFFGVANFFKDTFTQIAAPPRVLILRLRAVGVLDSTGMRALRDIVHRFRRDGTLVLLAELHAQPKLALENSELGDEMADQVFITLEDALEHAREVLAEREAEAQSGKPPDEDTAKR
ncbi:MAG TPA: SulP family inorganic anion transporter [Gemmatimonadaceae bacterium]|nr:SulP family inorganic anion transporter [Gemmatimonadaceae bacterium]